jgi:hypothetical protein
MKGSLNDSIRALEGSSSIAKIKIPIEAGILFRGAVRDWVKYAQSYRDLSVHAFENKGWIDSDFTIEIEGAGERIAAVLTTLQRSLPVEG